MGDYVNSLTDPSSPNYHHWLTAQSIGEKFGISPTDLTSLLKYLNKLGLSKVTVWPDRLFLSAETTRQNAESAFNVNIQGYNRTGAEIARGLSSTYFAPDKQPSIDSSAAQYISAIFGLSNAVQYRPAGSLTGVKPDASASGYFDPIDLSNAYNTTPLHNKGLNGQGETVAIFSPTAFQQSDITRFESANGITSASVNVVNVTGQNGVSGTTDLSGQAEACIDIETVLGQAPAAKVNVYEAPNDGGFEIFEQMEKDDPNIVSVSWGVAEDECNQAYANAYETIRQALAAEGITVFVATGDSGAFDANNPSVVSASVDASSAYVTAVGGTELSPLSNAAWNGEVAWTYKDGTVSGNAGSGGGVSIYIPQPSWQVGVGVSTKYSDGMRQIPDVAALASRPYYDISTQGGWYGYGGTSCSTPLWAGSVALIEESLGTRLGNIDPKLYAAAASSTSPFHDITSGNDGFYSCTTGWDFVTGWGSVDFSKLLTSFGGSAPSTGFSLSSSPSAVSVAVSNKATTTVSLTNSSAAAVSAILSISGAPNGVTVSFSPASVTNSTASTATFTTTSSAAPGTYPLTVTGTAGGTTATTKISLTITAVPVLTSITVTAASSSVLVGSTDQFTAVAKDQFGNALAAQPAIAWSVSGGGGTISSAGLFSPKTVGGPYTVTASAGGKTGTAAVTVTAVPTFNLTVSPSSLSIKQGFSGSAVLTLTSVSGFSGSVSVTVAGVPQGVTVSGSSTATALNLSFAAAITSAVGTSTVTITGTSGTITKTSTITLTVVANPTLTSITISPLSSTVVAGSTKQFTASALDQNGKALSPQPVFTWAVSGGGTISSSGLYSATTSGGPYTVTVSSGSAKASTTITVTPAPSFTLATNPNQLSVNEGSTAKTTISLSALNGFASASALTLGTLPSGVTATLSTSSITVNSSSILTFTASPTAPAGTYSVAVTVKSGTLTGVATISLTVVKSQVLTTISVSPSGVTVVAKGTQLFTAGGYDQFGVLLATQPSFSWSIASGGIGSVSTAGLYTAGTAAGTATVVAAVGSIKGSVIVKVVLPPSVSGLKLSTTSVTGGATVTGTVTLSSAALAGGTVVSVTTSNSKVAAAPTTLTVPAGASSAAFTVSTTKPSSSTSVTLGASSTTSAASATLKVN